jgi:hypothetical protein
MAEPPELTPDYFEILAVRELRKAGFEVTGLHVERQARLPPPESSGAYLRELTGLIRRAAWQRAALIACRRQDTSIGGADVESLRDHIKQAGVAAGILFSTAVFEADALKAAEEASLALFRVTDGRTAFDTSGWGTPGHYPAWLPAYCAQVVSRDVSGQVRYRLVESGQGEVLQAQLETRSDAGVDNKE